MSERVPELADRASRVQSVDRAAALLRAIARSAGPGLTATALAAECGLNRATAWRLLSTLEASALVARDRGTGRWTIGIGLVEIAGTGGVDAMVRAARGTLDHLSRLTGETAALGVVRSGRLTYVDEVVPGAVVAATWRGRAVPLHATSSGKAYLAHLPRDTVDRLLRTTGLSDHTRRTVTDRASLDAELERVREVGYGVCRGEYEAEAWGVSAAVLDSVAAPLAVLSIWGPAERLTEDRFESLGALVARAAQDLSPVR